MNKKLIDARDNFIEKMGFLGTLFGFSKLVGQIYGLLYLSPRPLSLNDLMDALRVSKGSISTNIRELEKWGGCKKVWVKDGDSRKDFYEAETNFKNIVNKRLIDAIKRRISTVGQISEDTKNVLSDPKNGLNKEEKEILEFYNRRIDKIESVRKKLELMINTATKFL